ncbi:MAG: substrate-binding domain-containing protein [Nitrospirota bacterium]|jgi:molybdate transport system substrate-binding protein
MSGTPAGAARCLSRDFPVLPHAIITGTMGEEMHYPLIPPERADDIHGIEHMDSADLVLFLAGNQFMAAPKLLAVFRSLYPDVREIFYETLPPGLELRQILAGGAMFRGMKLTGRPDVYTSVTEEAMEKLKAAGRIREYSLYLRNRLVLMVARGNPRGISTVGDLARDEIVVSQPGELEDIRHYTRLMYVASGGEELARRVMEGKQAEGTTLATVVHHRETPRRITQGAADAGPVWYTEVLNAQKEGLEVDALEVGPQCDQRDRVGYYCAALADAPHPGNARRFVDFLASETAQDVFEEYGFLAIRRQR